MNVSISERHQKASCLWCEKDRECVTASFEDSFLQDSVVCWACLQNIVRVRSGQPSKTQAASKSAG